jgi:small conductance mechanosensitive channel
MAKTRKKKVLLPIIQEGKNGNTGSKPFNITLYWTFKMMVSIMILYIAYRFARKIADLIINEVKKHVSQHKKLIIRQLSEVLFYVIFGFGVFVALINLGVQTATIVTLLGTAMVTIGLALQGTMSNIFSGVYVALSENFQIGDTIRVYIPFIPGGPIEGKVVDFNIAYVKLQDARSGKMLFLPNISVASNVLVNLSRSPPKT